MRRGKRRGRWRSTTRPTGGARRTEAVFDACSFALGVLCVALAPCASRLRRRGASSWSGTRAAAARGEELRCPAKKCPCFNNNTKDTQDDPSLPSLTSLARDMPASGLGLFPPPPVEMMGRARSCATPLHRVRAAGGAIERHRPARRRAPPPPRPSTTAQPPTAAARWVMLRGADCAPGTSASRSSTGGLAAATLALGRLDLEVPLFYTVSNFSLRNESDPSAGWDLTPLYQPTDGGLPMTPLVAAFFVLSALAHLLNGSLLYNYYVAQLQRCYTPTRWVEYFFSAPLVQLLVAVTLGVRDRSLLLAFVFLTAITMPFGYWVEMIGRPRTPTAWRRPLSERLAPYWLGHVPQVGGGLIAQFYASDTLQASRSSCTSSSGARWRSSSPSARRRSSGSSVRRRACGVGGALPDPLPREQGALGRPPRQRVMLSSFDDVYADEAAVDPRRRRRRHPPRRCRLGTSLPLLPTGRGGGQPAGGCWVWALAVLDKGLDEPIVRSAHLEEVAHRPGRSKSLAPP